MNLSSNGLTGSKKRRIYKLKPDPALLYNAAQAYRMAGNNDNMVIALSSGSSQPWNTAPDLGLGAGIR